MASCQNPPPLPPHRCTCTEAQLDNLKTEKQLRLSDKVSEVTARLRGLWKGYEDLTGHKLDVPLSEDISEAVYSDLTAKAADAEVCTRGCP